MAVVELQEDSGRALARAPCSEIACGEPGPLGTSAPSLFVAVNRPAPNFGADVLMLLRVRRARAVNAGSIQHGILILI